MNASTTTDRVRNAAMMGDLGLLPSPAHFPQVAADLGREVVSLMQQRQEADVALLREAYRCRDWPQLLELQTGWASAACDDYFESMRRCTDLLVSSGNGGGNASKAQTTSG
ncbi:MAG: phasin family protein [Pseudomonadota bacterium]